MRACARIRPCSPWIDAEIGPYELDRIYGHGDELPPPYALVAITFREAWAIDLVNGDPGEAGQGSAGPHNAAGYPNITVAVGYARELPVGLSFVAEAWSEPKLLRLAYAFEQGDPVRRVPRLLDHYGERDFVAR